MNTRLLYSFMAVPALDEASIVQPFRVLTSGVVHCPYCVGTVGLGVLHARLVPYFKSSKDLSR